jgi:hypothetical protein
MRPSPPPGPSRRRTSTALSSRIALLGVALALHACGDAAPDDGGSTVQVTREMDGDTLVVRTTAGSVWGGEATLEPLVSVGVLDGAPEEMFGNVNAVATDDDGRIYVLDRQIPTVRVFDTDGSYLHSLGRDGNGPGELAQPDGGLAVLSDGRVAVRDPGNARMQLFDARGDEADSWPVISGGFATGTPLFHTAGDTLLTPVLMEADVDVTEWRMGLQRIGPDGAIVDTLPVPVVDWDTPTIEARTENSVSMNTVPFSPDDQWTFHRDGYFVHGISDDYSFSLLRPMEPLRIERAWEPVPVRAGEKAQRETAIAANFRRMVPGWRWDGPAIPDLKPAFRRIYTGRSGRIWIMVHTPGVEGEDPDYDPTDPNDVEERWSEPVAFDVFESDGTYLGRVAAPDGMSPWPAPVFDGDTVLAVVRDEFDVPRVVRFRVVPPGAAAPG